MRWPWTRRDDELQNRIEHLEHALWEEQHRVNLTNRAINRLERSQIRFRQHSSAVAEVITNLVPGAEKEYERIEEWNDRHPSSGKPHWLRDIEPSDTWADDLPEDPDEHPTYGWCPPIGEKDF